MTRRTAAVKVAAPTTPASEVDVIVTDHEGLELAFRPGELARRGLSIGTLDDLGPTPIDRMRVDSMRARAASKSKKGGRKP